ncbi:hypothetical protein GCM10009733_092800 [Nonomuraea maheshkhaliensis]|uniref:Uncharacterized protein n=1 Tax=Nonomuraea maheshkhaliensis TaxID=419590 RepID=A0ABN2H492_9ACTN
MIGIDPALMTQLINGMTRVSSTLPELGYQLERTLTSLGLQLWGPSPIQVIARQLHDQIPTLQGRLDLILATPDQKPDTGGALWANDSAWLSASPAEGAASAELLATRLRERIGAHSLDAETVALLERHKNDPYFALAFITEIPPRELKALIVSSYGSDLSPSSRPAQYDVALQDRLATILSTILGTASRGVGRMRLADDHAARLAENIENPQDAFAVKKLLQDGDFDHTYLLTLVRDLYDHDVAHPPDLSLPRDPWSRPGPRDVSPGDLSAMGTALTALAHHPAVAQDFFTDPKRRPLAYLMRRHPWDGGTDGELGWAIEVAATEFRDHDLPPGDSRGYKSALIASWAVHFWSDPNVQANLPLNRTHLGRVLAQYPADVHRTTGAFSAEVPGVVAYQDPDKNLRGLEPYGARFNAKEVKNAMTWAFEEDDVFEAVAAAHGLYSVEILDEVAGKIAKEVEADLAAWRRRHPEATEDELNVIRQDILEDRMTRGGGAEFSRAARSLSRATWVIADAANIADIEEAKENDARFTAFKELADTAVGLAPTPQGAFVGFMALSAKSTIFRNLRTNGEERSRASADDALRVTQSMFTDLTVAAMMRHGLFGNASAPGRTHPYYHKDFSPGRPGHFISDGRIRSRHEMNDDQSNAYHEWLELNATGRVFGRPDEAIDIGFSSAKKYYSGHGS